MSSDPPSSKPTGWFPHIRALLVGLHIVAITAMAFPAPGEGMVRSAWKDPTVRVELDRWHALFARCGIDWTREQFEEGLWEAASTYMNTRARILDPFGPYYEWCGTMQSWRMFTGPHRFPSRLWIEVEEQQTWRPVYVQRHAVHDWLAWYLDRYRFRPVLYRFSWYRHVPGYQGIDEFARWVARHAARDFPDAERVRVRLHTFRTPSPEAVRAGEPIEGEFATGVVVPLEKDR
jgi:hypothetical protein